MRNVLVEKWEKRLKGIFDKIDQDLEEKYGNLYPLHPARAKKGQAANPEDSGLFELTATFTPGFSSPTGEGYVFKIRWATLERIDSEKRQAVEADVLRLLAEELPRVFPGRALRVLPEGDGYKIVGDLSLD